MIVLQLMYTNSFPLQLFMARQDCTALPHRDCSRNIRGLFFRLDELLCTSAGPSLHWLKVLRDQAFPSHIATKAV